MDIEDFLDSDAIPKGAACDFDKFLMVGDKKYMKSSVITAMLSSKRARKVTIPSCTWGYLRGSPPSNR
jgi:hypothetical protein